MDLTTRYLGRILKSPIIASASPLSGHLDNIRRLEGLSAGAVVLPSIFQERIEQEQQLVDRLTAIGADSYAEALSYFLQPLLAVYVRRICATKDDHAWEGLQGRVVPLRIDNAHGVAVQN
jgi:dihydroorotate dehydrogenase